MLISLDKYDPVLENISSRRMISITGGYLELMVIIPPIILVSGILGHEPEF